jgi:hypothetical protein
MRDVWPVVRATLRAGRKRRASLILLILVTALLGVIAFGTFMDLRQQRRFFDEALRTGGIPITCEGSGESGGAIACRFMGPAGPLGPSLEQEAFEPKDTPPGPDFRPPELELLRRMRSQIEPEFRRQIRQQEGNYSPRRLFVVRTKIAGTFWGVLFAVLIGATLFGAEWRWSVWRTHLTHEPRRGRVLAGKVISLWIMVAAGFAVVLTLLAGIDQVFRAIFDVSARGGPGYASIAIDVARSLLSLELYATAAGATALIARTSIVGLAAPLGMLLGDGLLTNRFSQLRPFSATQQIAWLITRPENAPGPFAAVAWWPKITAKLTCAAGLRESFDRFTVPCREIKLPPIPQTRAILVLLAWVAAFVAAAYLALRARDVPQ